jgi:hypothetical protein
MIWLEIWNNKNWPTKVKQQQCTCISSTTVKLGQNLNAESAV